MKKEHAIILGIFIIALVLRIAFVFSSPIKIWDETVYANLGHDLSKNPFDYSFSGGWSDYVPCGSDAAYCWPKAGFRAMLLPYTLSVFYFLNLPFLVEFLMPLIGALGVVLVYFLAKRMFEKKVAICSAILLTVLPLHAYYSGKMLTDVFSTFFVILTVLFFWQGFEKGQNKYKILFGIILALSILARYTSLWLIPIFPIYLFIKYRNLSFLKDRSVWLTIGLFFATLLPWFIYSTFTYGSPLGAFVHALKAASYWGGIQPWYFFFEYALLMFSILAAVFVASLIYITYNKSLRKNRAVVLLLLWFLVIFISASAMPHKEDRFLMPLVPPLVMLSSLLLANLKKYRTLILGAAVAILAISVGFQFAQSYTTSYTQTDTCFLESMSFLKSAPADSIVITDESTIVYYYVGKTTRFYPGPFSLDNIRNLVDESYRNRSVYISFTEYDMSLNKPENRHIKDILDSNFEIVQRCPADGESSVVYKYS